jgi:cytochrome c
VRNRSIVIAFVLSLVIGTVITTQAAAAQARFSVLVFSKVNGFYHDSIPAGQRAITELGAEHGFDVTVSDDPALFTDQGLAPFDAVVFNNTNSRNGAILGQEQRAAFERYIRAGGGYTGVHSASGTEYDWPWYGRLMGAFFKSHPAIQPVAIQVDDRVHPSTKDLPQVWQRTEEPYDFTANPRGGVHVLASLDVRSYTGHTMGADHPISWCQDFDGGRSWYTGLGHDPSAFDEPALRAHLLGGIEWAAGAADGDCGPTEDDRWRKTMLDGDTDDPLDLEIDARGRVFYIQRQGWVKVYDPEAGYSHEAGRFDVLVNHTHGMHGLVLHPDFEENGYLYLFYSPADKPVNRLSRVTFDETTMKIDPASEVVQFEFFSQREINAHEGGGMAFDSHGNLYLATGDNADPCCEGYAPIDERPGRQNQDAQGTSANTNDLRGKILRIHPEDDGTYTIPEDNLFPQGTAKTRPEIYVMGLRNPYRIHIDPETDWLYWGEVGPDARADDPARGPKGHDEFNLAKSAGNFGWPLCIADNKAYVEYDFATGVSGTPYDCANGPVNNSPNNTGLTTLPPARPAWLPYPYDASPQWPELGTGGRLAIGGPKYHHDPDLASETKLPAYFDDTVFVADWTRNAIFEVKSGQDGEALSINRFLPSQTFLRPIDMEIGKDGSLYLIEWGTNYGGSGRGDPNFDSALYRIDYLRPGQRAPQAEATATPSSGKAPLRVQFANTSADPDSNPDGGQRLGHTWDFDGDGVTDSTDVNPTHTYTENGEYTATLTVTDPTGRTDSTEIRITVGNTAPEVTLESPVDGQVFDWGVGVPYTVDVVDAEDGFTEDGSIACREVVTEYGVRHARQDHPMGRRVGCAGRAETVLDELHTTAEDVEYYLESSYEDTGGLTHTDRVTLQPRVKQADHYDNANGVRILANTADGVSAGLVGQIHHGDWVSYEPVSLEGVPLLRFRVASQANGGTIEIRRDSPAGPLLGSVAVPVTGGGTTWTEVTAPVTDPGGTHALYLVFTNPATTGLLFNLDRFEFGSQVELANLTLPTPISAGDAGFAEVDVVNGTNRRITANVGLTVPTDWTQTPVRVEVPRHEIARVRIRFTSPEPGAVTGPLLEARVTATATVAGGVRVGSQASATGYLMPSTKRSVYSLDAGSPTSPLEPGYARLDPTVAYTEATGFGWVDTAGLESRDRGGPDELRQDMVTSQRPATLRLRIPAGQHTVSLLRGDSQFAAQPIVVTVDGRRVVDGGVPVATNRWGWNQFTVDGGQAGRTVDVTFGIDIAQFWRLNTVVVEKVVS